MNSPPAAGCPPLATIAALVAAVVLAACSSGGTSQGGADRPAPTTAPAPSAGAGPGSRERPVPLGTEAVVSDRWRVKVARAVPDAAATLREAGVAAEPRADRQLYLVTVDVTYVGGGVASPRNSLSFAAVDSEGEYGDGDTCAVADPVPSAEQVSGRTTTGSVCFAVRPELAPSLVLVVEAGFLGTGQVHFALR